MVETLIRLGTAAGSLGVGVFLLWGMDEAGGVVAALVAGSIASGLVSAAWKDESFGYDIGGALLAVVPFLALSALVSRRAGPVYLFLHAGTLLIALVTWRERKP